MRVCLVSSVNLGSWYSPEREPATLSLPLGLLSLAAVLEGLGHQVSLVDFNYALTNGELSLDDGFYSNAAARIEASSPQLVGFSTMCNSYHISLRMAEAIKARLPAVPVVLGGPQASVVDAETLGAFSFVDMVLRGEAEQTLPRLIAELTREEIPCQVPGLTYRVGGRIVRNQDAPLLPDLDSLPVPAYHLFPYGTGGAPAIDVGRGCPFACTFCSTSGFWRRRFRLKSIDRIMREMWILKREYQATAFTLMHDLFTVNRRRLHAFCERLQSEKMEVTWSCSARVDCVDPALLRHMADSGCRAVFYGVETGSARMQRDIRKNLRLDQVWSAVDATLDAKMGTTVSFIAGFPTEAEEDLCQSMAVIQSLLGRPQVNVQLHILAPQVGTPDYDRYADRLRFDGYYSDIAGAGLRLLEPEWFRQHPALFSSFYYFETDQVPRRLLRGLDLFVHGPCSVTRDTVRYLLQGGRSLWSLYRDWRDWADARGLGGGPMAAQNLDEFLLNFYEFASDQVAVGRADFDLGKARDQILAFYLRYYGQVPVRFVGSTAAETLPSAADRMEVDHGIHHVRFDAGVRV
jgi:radical SAM superfamily enzyme YgiQ (UPF0313 family)